MLEHFISAYFFQYDSRLLWAKSSGEIPGSFEIQLIIVGSHNACLLTYHDAGLVVRADARIGCAVEFKDAAVQEQLSAAQYSRHGRIAFVNNHLVAGRSFFDDKVGQGTTGPGRFCGIQAVAVATDAHRMIEPGTGIIAHGSADNQVFFGHQDATGRTAELGFQQRQPVTGNQGVVAAGGLQIAGIDRTGFGGINLEVVEIARTSGEIYPAVLCSGEEEGAIARFKTTVDGQRCIVQFKNSALRHQYRTIGLHR